jgi:flagellar biosynthesis/type III secretory pathway M-ring protein FliF/YscJ
MPEVSPLHENLADEIRHEISQNLDRVGNMSDEEVIPDTTYDNINLNPKDNNIQQVEKFIDKSPEAVAQLLRKWLSE